MKYESKVCRGAMIEQAVGTAVLWFSLCTLLSSFSIYGWIDSILYNSPSNVSYFVQTSIGQPLEVLDGSSLQLTLSRMQDTTTASSELDVNQNYDCTSNSVETEHTVFGEDDALGINKNRPTTPTREEYVLLAFKQSVEEDPLGVLDSWYIVGGEEGFFCTWIGVTCDLQKQHVVALELAGMQLQGTITKELHFLPFLATLNLSSNFLHGMLPGELSECTVLRYLDLSKNQLSGPIPPKLGTLKFLEGLWLQDNHLSGPLPYTLGHCRRLIMLSLSYNKLTGSIPLELSGLPRLTVIELQGNDLMGSIPATLGRCSALRLVDFSQNKLMGIIPPELGNLGNLQTLSLGKNQLSGEIPASFANCSKLVSLNLCDNQLTGVLPTAVLTLRSLVYLSLRKNLLKGNMLGDLREGFTSNLKYLDISQNQLTGRIPATFAANFRSMCYLNLSQNSFVGSIPLELSTLTSVVALDLSRNRLVGSIPSEIGDIVSPRHLHFSANKVSGQVPRSWTSIQELHSLDLSNYCLTVSIPQSPYDSRIPSTSFQGNMTPCARKRLTGCHSQQKELASTPNSVGLILIPVTAVLGLVAVGVSIWFYGHRKHHRRKVRREVIICPEIKCFPSRCFTLTAEEVRQATESCDECNVVWRGRLSCVYKVVVTGRKECTVRKIVKNHSYRAQRRFIQDLQIIGSLRHRNLVKLLAYFSDAQTNALIYEYVPDGSLQKHLLQTQELPWVTRFTLAVDVARALVYLHNDSALPIVHGSLKPSNIFVNVKRSETRIGDVGLGRYAGPSSINEDLNESGRRHQAYTAPEILHLTCAERMEPSADVYSFGIVLLELITGTGPDPDRYSGGECLPQTELVKSLPFKLEKLYDPAIQISFYSRQIKQCLRIALLCTNQRPQERPRMLDVMEMLTQVPKEDS